MSHYVLKLDPERGAHNDHLLDCVEGSCALCGATVWKAAIGGM